MLLDVLQGIPTASVVELGPGESYSQGAHVLLLRGSLLSPAAPAALAAPGVLPWLSTVAASWYARAGDQLPPQQQVKVTAGSEGATLVVCPSSAHPAAS